MEDKCVLCGQRPRRQNSTLCAVCAKRPWMEQIVGLLTYLNGQAKMAWREDKHG